MPDVVRFNNMQNVVRAADFRSNDPIQVWLDRKFSELKAIGAIPGITYFRKRISKRARRNTERLTLEELAKIRYAWLHDPTRCVADPKSLWTNEEDGGVYEKAFGIDGNLLNAWTDGQFNQTLTAIVFYWTIEAAIDRIRKKNKAYQFLRRLRYFALALVPAYLEIGKIDAADCILDRNKFELIFKGYWGNALRELNSLHHSFV